MSADKITIAYKFRIAPTYAQRVQLWAAAEMARHAWNWTVALCEREYIASLIAAGVLEQAEIDACVKRKHRVAVIAKAAKRARDEKIKLKRPSINRGRLYKAWCEMRDSTVNSIKEYHSHVYSYPIDRVVKAYKDFWRNKGGRHGAPVPHGPTYTSSFTIQLTRKSWDDGAIKIPMIGWIPTTWRNRGRWCGEDPENRIPPGKPCSVTVTCRANDWYASISMKDVEDFDARGGQGTVGLDIGISAIVTTSDGDRYDPPRPLEKALKQLAKLQRRRQRKPKRSRRRTLLDIQIARLHAKVTEIRRDHLNNLSTALARKYETVVVEGFDIVGLVSEAVDRRRSRRAIMDLGWGEFRRQLGYKLEWRGGQCVVVDKLHPTNRQCHACWKHGVLTFNECPHTQPIYKCSVCKTKVKRQDNTALLLKSFGEGHWPPSGGTGAQPETDARGGSDSAVRGAGPLKREHLPSREGASGPSPGVFSGARPAPKKRTQDPGSPTSDPSCVGADRHGTVERAVQRSNGALRAAGDRGR